jgi:beta-galactosidase
VTPFGIRELKWSATTGLTLNGAMIKLKGACHHNLVPAGAAVPDEMYERAIRELKASGCTSIRTSHNPLGPEFYDYCDQIGIMVMDEWVDKWSQTADKGVYYTRISGRSGRRTLIVPRARQEPSMHRDLERGQ